MILTEATQGHNTGIDAATIGAAHDDHASHIEVTIINLTATHPINHIADSPHIEISQCTKLGITVDQSQDHNTDV